MTEFKQYRRKSISEMRPYVEGEILEANVSISEADLKNGSPKLGDMIARNPKNHEDQWLVAKDYFQDNLEEIRQKLSGIIGYEDEVTENKQLRKDTDEIIQRIKDLPPSRERSLAITKLQEGVMWLGMDLKRLGEANPYPSNKDASTGTQIEPTADGLKF